MMIYRLAGLVTVILALTGCGTTGQPGPFEIYLVRHAEKAETGRDPPLTRAGLEHAEELAVWLAPRKLSAVWSSDYQRTRQTAAPAARRSGLSVRIYDPRKLEDLAALLMTRTETALVVGHSNTTPELAALLCDCPVEAMPESEYGRIIVVTVDDDHRAVRELVSAKLSRAGPER